MEEGPGSGWIRLTVLWRVDYVDRELHSTDQNTPIFFLGYVGRCLTFAARKDLIYSKADVSSCHQDIKFG